MKGRHRFSAVVAVLAIASCREQVFEPVSEGLVATAVVEGDVTVVTKVDLLFVIDDSPSMANEQEKLAAGFPMLVDALDALRPPVDWRVAVMTTSVEERFGPCDPRDADAPSACSAAFGASGFRCEENTCVRSFPDRAGRLRAAPGNPVVLERNTLASTDLLKLFSQNIRAGTGGSRHEQPLRAVRLGLERGLDGFVRPDGKLVVVIASDEDDCSDTTGRFVALEQRGGDYVDHCLAEAQQDTGALDQTGDWTRFLRSWARTGKTRGVAVAALAGIVASTGLPGDCVDEACARRCGDPASVQRCDGACLGSLRPAVCASECVAQCASFCGSQAPGLRIARVVRELSGPLASICESDYGPTLAALARVVGIPDAIALPSAPSDARAFFFTVARAGRVLHCREGLDFTLDTTSVPAAMNIVPSGACRLLPGDLWRIEYVADD